MPPHAVVSVSLRGRTVEEAEISTALATALLFLGVLGLAWLVFVAFGYPPVDALFEVASATGTVGLSCGIARPELEGLLKALLCAVMWLGRLEILPLLVAAHPATWRAVEE
jgi:trk system potassium uptake protein TrkH